MDFLNPKKKRAHRIRLLIGYALVGVAVAMITLILVLQAYGYDINRQNGDVIQNGLVFVDSHPVSADISVNNEEKGQTNQRLILPAGQYRLQLKREDYRTWQHDFSMEGAGVERLVYPMMIPKILTPQDIQLYAGQPSLVTGSPDRRWLLIQQPGKLGSFDIVDIQSKSNATTTVNLPANVLTAKEGQHGLELVEWSNDNRHVLLKHSFAGGYEFVTVDRENAANAVNINRLFNIAPTKLVLRDKKPDQFYFVDAGSTLRQADAGNKAVTTVVDKVLEFHPDGANQILYASEAGAEPGSVMVRLRDGTKTTNIRQLTKSSSYLLDMAKFDNHWYVTLGNTTDQKIYIYRDPQTFTPKAAAKYPLAYRALRLDADPQFVSFSANTQFLAVQGGSKFAVYDFENNRQFRYDSNLKIPAGYKIPWMDGHRLAAVSDGVVVMFDFDNENRQILVAGDAGIQPFFDRDYERMYVLGPSVTVQGRQALTRTSIKL